MDILGNLGFVHTLALAFDVAPGGGSILGVVCDTWIFMSRGSMKRTRCRPLGIPDRCDAMRKANTM
eukprot:7562719-Prorocentrum_lima.AAC.1